MDRRVGRSNIVPIASTRSRRTKTTKETHVINNGRGPQPVDPDQQSTWACSCGSWGNAKAQPPTAYDNGRSALTLAKKYLSRHQNRRCVLGNDSRGKVFTHAGAPCRTRHAGDRPILFALVDDEDVLTEYVGCTACGRVVERESEWDGEPPLEDEQLAQ